MSSIADIVEAEAQARARGISGAGLDSVYLHSPPQDLRDVMQSVCELPAFTPRIEAPRDLSVEERCAGGSIADIGSGRARSEAERVRESRCAVRIQAALRGRASRNRMGVRLPLPVPRAQHGTGGSTVSAVHPQAQSKESGAGSGTETDAPTVPSPAIPRRNFTVMTPSVPGRP